MVINMNKKIIMLITSVILITLFFLIFFFTTKPSKAIFTLGLDEEVKVVYDFVIGGIVGFDGVHKRHVYYLSLENVNMSLKKAEFILTEIYPPDEIIDYLPENNTKYINLTVGKEYCSFVTEEGGAFFQLTELEDTRATFETWFGIGEPHPIGPFAPSEITKPDEAR